MTGILTDDQFPPMGEAADAPVVTMDTLAPNLVDINNHLHGLFAPDFVQDYPHAWIEIAVANPAAGEGERGPRAARKFSVFNLAGAAEHAAEQNRKHFNIYVGVAIRQGDTGPSNRASESNYLATAYAWADADGGLDRINGILEANDLPTSMTVMTGRTPHERGHLYFKLGGDVTAEQIKAANGALMTLLGTDDVRSPCSLMRLAGTVNWPTEAKRERGYAPELVTLHVRKNMPCYSFERLTGLAPQAVQRERSDAAPRAAGGAEPVERVRAALAAFSSNCSRMDWLKVAAALRDEYGETASTCSTNGRPRPKAVSPRATARRCTPRRRPQRTGAKHAA